MKDDILASARTFAVTMLGCCVLYPGILLVFAQVAVPESAQGSMVRDHAGRVVGSRLIAQSFSRPEYLWPRPSAVDYDAAATGGSNLGPSNPALRARVEGTLTQLGASTRDEVPSELVTASGSGMDPHVTLEGALYQADRIAAARGVSVDRVRSVLLEAAEPAMGYSIVNVLETNLRFDRELPTPVGGDG